MPRKWTIRNASAAGAAALAVLGAVACAPQEEPQSSSTPPTGDACAKDNLPTTTSGTLTIATDDPSFPPWVIDNEPENKQGFEAAVAYAVAQQLGYADDEVTWVRVPFNAAIQPGPKDFDFDINQFSITDERREAVDFSSPYYDVRQVVVTVAGSSLDGATSLADLAGAKLGAQVGTTSYDTIVDVIKPTQDPAVLNTNEDVVAQLQNGTIDGAVFDLPTAFYVTGAMMDNGVIVGQVPQPAGSTPEQFGLLLDKDSPLTACVTEAVDALRTDGTLADLEAQWLADEAGAPELT
jgi:polar amino acid transport system substrate-binding protein